MRMPLPPLEARSRIVSALRAFYQTSKRSWLRQALSEWAEYHQVRQPRVTLRGRKRWRRCADGKWLLGQTIEDGEVQLWTPESWRAHAAKLADDPSLRANTQARFTEAEYIGTILHELAHVLWFVEAERKADLYARRFVKGVSA